MAIVAGLIALVIIVVGLIILIPMFSDSFTATSEEIEDFNKGVTIGNNPTTSDTVCDLKLTVNGELDFANQDGRDIIIANPFETNLSVFINDKIAKQPPIEHSWLNCYTIDPASNDLVSLFGGLSIVDMLGQQNVDTLDVSGTAVGDSFTLRVEGQTPSGKLLTDNLKRISWEKRIKIEDGAQITIPYVFSHVFVLNDVKADNYSITITALEKSLNGEASNQGVEYRIFDPTG